MLLRHRFPSHTALALALAGALLAIGTASAADMKPASQPAADHAAKADDAGHAHKGSTSVNKLSTVDVTADALDLKQLPATTPLSATQPRSLVDSAAILNMQSPVTAFTDIIALTPSVTNSEPNGAGLGNSAQISIRGFGDGQFNLLMDGVPFGDANDFTHHSANYYMPQDMGSVSVDRGPGNASTIGYATFGGTVAMNSRDPAEQAGARVYGTYGSFATRMLGGSLDTGSLSELGGLRAYIDYRQLKSNGYLSGATLNRQNLFFKAVKDFSDDTRLTLGVMTNSNTGDNAAIIGATSYPYVAPNNGSAPFTSDLPGQMQVYGKNYGLSNDPASQAYTGINFDTVHTDLEFVRLTTRLGDVHVDNNLYTVSDYHRGWNGLDPNGGNIDYGTSQSPAGSLGDGTVPDGAGSTNGTYYGPSNVPAEMMYMLYRNWGDVLRFTQEVGPGELRYGVWYNKQLYHRYKAEVDATNNWAWNAATRLDAISRRIDGTFITAQPYLEYAWNITPAFTVTGGLKYSYFKRHDIAEVQQKVGAPQDYSQSWKKLLPAVDLHYAIDDGWSAYLQAAKGYLAPNENLFYVPNPRVSAQNVEPEQTTNYQLGTVWNGDRASIVADVYAINFSNQVSKEKIGGVTFFRNLGGVRYRGAELELSYLLGGGFSAYGNVSYNKATQQSDKLQVAGTPKVTGAASLIWHQGSWTASLVAKYTGANYGDIGSDAAGNDIGIYRFAPNTITNLSVHYVLPEAMLLPRGSKLSLQVFNLTDVRTLNTLSGYTAGNVPLFFATPGRSVMASFEVPVF